MQDLNLFGEPQQPSSGLAQNDILNAIDGGDMNEATNFLDMNASGWREHDNDLRFKKYLAQESDFPGMTREDIMKACFDKGDYWGVAKIYKQYGDSQTTSSAAVQPAFSSVPTSHASEDRAVTNQKKMQRFQDVMPWLRRGYDNQGRIITNEVRDAYIKDFMQAAMSEAQQVDVSG